MTSVAGCRLLRWPALAAWYVTQAFESAAQGSSVFFYEGTGVRFDREASQGSVGYGAPAFGGASRPCSAIFWGMVQLNFPSFFP